MLVVPKVWGREEILLNDEARNYCEKMMFLNMRGKCSMHYHPVKREEFIMERGMMLLTVETEPHPERRPGYLGRTRTLVLQPEAGVTKVWIEPYTSHSFVGLEDTVFREKSTFDRPEDSIRIPGMESRMLSEVEFKQLMKIARRHIYAGDKHDVVR